MSGVSKKWVGGFGFGEKRPPGGGSLSESVIRALLQAGAEVDAVADQDNGRTALMYAAQNGATRLLPLRGWECPGHPRGQMPVRMICNACGSPKTMASEFHEQWALFNNRSCALCVDQGYPLWF